MSLLNATQNEHGVLLTIKVVPGASRTAITGILDGALKVTVAAPAERGRANQALLRLLARKLKLPRNAVTIHTGHHHPHKVVLIKGLDTEQVTRELTPPHR